MSSEIRRIIQEALSSSKETYKTEGVPLDLYFKDVLGPYDSFDAYSKATIEWSMWVDEKSYGIKNLHPVIHKIIIEAQIYRGEGEEYVEEFEKVYEFEQGVQDGDVIEGFKLGIDKSEGSNSIFPTEISIDDERKYIDIHFQYP